MVPHSPSSVEAMRCTRRLGNFRLGEEEGQESSLPRVGTSGTVKTISYKWWLFRKPAWRGGLSTAMRVLRLSSSSLRDGEPGGSSSSSGKRTPPAFEVDPGDGETEGTSLLQWSKHRDRPIPSASRPQAGEWRYVPLVPPVEPLYTRDSSEDMSLLFSQCDTAMRFPGIPCESLSRPSQVSRERSAAKMALPWPVMLHARERVLLSGHAPGVCVISGITLNTDDNHNYQNKSKFQ
ncbi:hypothetical protein F7725_005171 [Dissostichus mawsoni]|uniref:Uncharacterized protein n=1 Tax=Dissostichus mawsoni TaxID=36200 RepID=A0A7J5YQM0_DISMA|nr:hypothetical protein F7725_005171 [Dissostichus mawsoni]